MTKSSPNNPAELAAEKALASLFKCLEQNRSFLLEAGAGAGKTYSLIEAIKYLIKRRGETFLRKYQKIACITYTNVACEEINKGVDGHTSVLSSTIHGFCWSIIKNYQKQLWNELTQLPKWDERLKEASAYEYRKIEYELGYPRVDNDKVSLGHNDVITLTILLMKNTKFRRLLVSQYPVIFIDEYQDTNKYLAESLLKYFVDSKSDCIIGFFGDGWQKIYNEGLGTVNNEKLKFINKQANFRSDSAIVNVLNRLRPELKQAASDPNSNGFVRVFHTNDWNGERLTGAHWNGDLPSDIAHNSLVKTREMLIKEGWDFDPSKTKILMLTNNILASEQGYSGIAKVFQQRNDDYIRKENHYINFFVNTLEPLCYTYEKKQYGNMFQLLDRRTPSIQSLADKVSWNKDMQTLINLRSNGTIGQIIDHLKLSERPRLSANLEKKEKEYSECIMESSLELNESLERIRQLKNLSYQEVVALTNYIEDRTPFSTKHGVKGAEFENVLVVMGRGWNQYNFDQFLQYWSDENKIPKNKLEFYERNRNLFYVAVSRPKSRLSLLFTQQLSNTAISVLSDWFGNENICSIADVLD
ncbi:ATP-dependent helicase [Paenibacillus sp. FJAT-27812]|uniref:ATP-dependent helicase n=1 Tax=Paenibacillus sp. FJAT-27812 TaxID=1684143 RepID=UPI0006A7B7AB|nr:ATP-dependent helicase [Paenibacillus sp. FJAT-27812]